MLYAKTRKVENPTRAPGCSRGIPRLTEGERETSFNLCVSVGWKEKNTPTVSVDWMLSCIPTIAADTLGCRGHVLLRIDLLIVRCDAVKFSLCLKKETRTSCESIKYGKKYILKL